MLRTDPEGHHEQPKQRRHQVGQRVTSITQPPVRMLASLASWSVLEREMQVHNGTTTGSRPHIPVSCCYRHVHPARTQCIGRIFQSMASGPDMRILREDTPAEDDKPRQAQGHKRSVAVVQQRRASARGDGTSRVLSSLCTTGFIRSVTDLRCPRYAAGSRIAHWRCSSARKQPLRLRHVR
jgi:hypothetical protein